jgi:hypothetical protein
MQLIQLAQMEKSLYPYRMPNWNRY